MGLFIYSVPPPPKTTKKKTPRVHVNSRLIIRRCDQVTYRFAVTEPTKHKNTILWLICLQHPRILVFAAQGNKLHGQGLNLNQRGLPDPFPLNHTQRTSAIKNWGTRKQTNIEIKFSWPCHVIVWGFVINPCIDNNIRVPIARSVN